MEQVFLIKLSGEAVSGKYGSGLDFDYIQDLCLRIKECHDLGVGIGIVCGGGNFLRGRDAHVMDRETADYTGMLATVMNSLVLKDTFKRIGCQVYNQTGLSVKTIDDIDAEKAKRAIDEGKIVIFGGGEPVEVEGKIIGALGVSGGTAEQDTMLAAYGKEILKEVISCL